MKIPSPKSHGFAARLSQVESQNVTYLAHDFPVFWESAKGSRVKDVDGNEFLDLTSAFGVVNLGHRPREIRRALQDQSQKMWHGMGDVHPNAAKVLLLETLAQITPGTLQKTILSSSGAEAVESALKTAGLASGKPGVLAFDGGYHGLSYGALAVTHRADFRAPFRNQLPKTATHLPFPDRLRGPTEAECLQRVKDLLSSSKGKTIGACIVEPVQGRGGARAPSPQFLQQLQRLLRERDVLLIADEIFTGFGRTGRLFAVEHSGVTPDLMCLGKAMSNGFPISACIGTSTVMDAWPVSDGEAIHTSTFLGNPLGCAMALAAIGLLRNAKLLKHVRVAGERWKAALTEELSGIPSVGEVRGVGLMIGIELVQDRKSLRPAPAKAASVITRALQKGLIVLAGGNHRNVLTLTPPLILTKREMAEATGILVSLIRGI